MKKYLRMLAGLMLTVIITITSIVPVSAANITTTATGYTSADDVKYQYHGSYISNWGARGEVATCLSPNAEKFYTGSYTYDVLSDKQGGSSQSNAYTSALYKALQFRYFDLNDEDKNFYENLKNKNEKSIYSYFE